MKKFDVQAIQLPVNQTIAFNYIADRYNLPAWTNAFSEISATKAMLKTPAGEVNIDLDVVVDEPMGIIDWILKFPDGSQAKACSRVLSIDDESCAYSFTLFAPPVPLSDLEGTLSEQSKILANELNALQGIIQEKVAAA